MDRATRRPCALSEWPGRHTASVVRAAPAVADLQRAGPPRRPGSKRGCSSTEPSCRPAETLSRREEGQGGRLRPRPGSLRARDLAPGLSSTISRRPSRPRRVGDSGRGATLPSWAMPPPSVTEGPAGARAPPELAISAGARGARPTPSSLFARPELAPLDLLGPAPLPHVLDPPRRAALPCRRGFDDHRHLAPSPSAAEVQQPERGFTAAASVSPALPAVSAHPRSRCPLRELTRPAPRSPQPACTSAAASPFVSMPSRSSHDCAHARRHGCRSGAGPCTRRWARLARLRRLRLPTARPALS